MRRRFRMDRRLARPGMRDETRDWLKLMAKSFLMVVGGILFVAGLVDLVVTRRPGVRNMGALLVGLAMCVPPLAFAFREALAEARKGRI